MPNYRRAFVPGGMYFFTVVTERRAGFLCEPAARALLRRSFRDCRERWPFATVAIVLLPDHLHAIWSLPPGDADFSTRWSWIKRTFAKGWVEQGGSTQPVSGSRSTNRRLGVWQRRFWEHSIRDERDLENHCDYIHYNPVKHGRVACPRDWPHSSFARFVRAGSYPADWGCTDAPPPRFDHLDDTAME